MGSALDNVPFELYTAVEGVTVVLASAFGFQQLELNSIIRTKFHQKVVPLPPDMASPCCGRVLVVGGL